MVVTLLFLLFPILIESNLLCETKEGAEFLLYQICALDISCRGLYNIPESIIIELLSSLPDNNGDSNIIKSNPNFDTFKYQTRKLNLILPMNGETGNTLDLTNNNGGVYNVIWGKKWIEAIKHIGYIATTTNTSMLDVNDCYQLDVYNNVSSNLLTFIIPTLYILNIHKSFMSMDETCHDVNERLIIDTENGRFRCVCMEDKECGEEGVFRTLLASIAALGIALVIIIGIVLVYTSIVIMKKLDIIVDKISKK